MMRLPLPRKTFRENALDLVPPVAVAAAFACWLTGSWWYLLIIPAQLVGLRRRHRLPRLPALPNSWLSRLRSR